jgi:predicted AAA+ superfamily ATPase
MLDRRIAQTITSRLERMPAVVLLGPRQVGRTTLAKQVAKRWPTSHYVDLATAPNRDLIRRGPRLYLEDHANDLVILDEVQRVPGLFEELRGIMDRGRRGHGRANGRFLLVGSASQELLGQSGEPLAGRAAYRMLYPLGVTEVPAEDHDTLWVRGGFPKSFLAVNDRASRDWRRDLVATCIERDIPTLGPRVQTEALHLLWTMLAREQGGLLNASQLARDLGIDGKTVVRYIDILAALMLVRPLHPCFVNIGKRLTKASKIFVRDSGLVHALLGLDDHDSLLSHPVVAASWEGFAIENLIGSGEIGDSRPVAGFYRTAAGAEVDLVLEWADERWAIDTTRSLNPVPTRGFRSAIKDVDPSRSFVVYPGTERYRIAPNIEAIGLPDLCQELIAQAR